MQAGEIAVTFMGSPEPFARLDRLIGVGLL